ncbi:MAG: DUF3379 family protein [Pseudomonadota bacterium]
MNYEEFEKSLLAEPMSECEKRRALADESPECRALERKVMQLEKRLSAALAIPVPESVENAPLPSDDVGNTSSENVVSLDARRRSRAPIWLAAAACLALVSVLVLRQPQVDTVDYGAQLAAEIVEHIGPELGMMVSATEPVSQSKLDKVLAAGVGGTQLDRDAPLVSYAKSCVINGQLVPHLVMQGEDGPVTVLLMPGERVDGPVSIMQDGVEGVILPVGDGGSIAIIGRDAASVESIKKAAMEAVEFSI